MVQFTLNDIINHEISEEDWKRLSEAENDISYDDDCPPLTEEQLKKMKRVQAIRRS